MASFHFSVKSISRGQGHSAVAAAAYRAGMKLDDDRLGVKHDYTKRYGVMAVEMFAPKDAPGWMLDPTQLWNRVELFETRKNARTGREMIVSLPHELDENQRLELVRDFSNHLVERYGVAVQSALHKPDRNGDQRNFHAHILMTNRRVDASGFGAYTAQVYDDFKKGPLEILAVREHLANLTNSHLERAGISERVDHRTLEDQALDAAERGDVAKARELDRQPTVKEGHSPDRRRAAKSYNARIRAENTTRQQEWDRLEEQARNEARLMPAHSDHTPTTHNRSINGKNQHSRKRPSVALTNDSINSCRLRCDPAGTKPMLHVPVGHRLATLKPRWGEPLGGGSLQRDEPRHRGGGQPLHGLPSLKGTGAIAHSKKPASPKGALILGKSAATGGKARLVIEGNADARKALQLDQERLDGEESARRYIKQREADLLELLQTLSNTDAIKWRYENRRITEAQVWLETHRDEEQRRFREREQRKRDRDAAWARLQEWKAHNPEPWRILPSHKTWAAALEEQTKPMREAHTRYQLAKTAADLPALQELERQRLKVQRQLERATANRQAIAMLPEEIQRQQIVLPTAPPPTPVEPQNNTPAATRSRWGHFPTLMPPR